MIRGLEETQREIRRTRNELLRLGTERKKKVDEIRRMDSEIIKKRELLKALYDQVMHFNRTLRKK